MDAMYECMKYGFFKHIILKFNRYISKKNTSWNETGFTELGSKLFFIWPKCKFKVVCWINYYYLAINFAFFQCLSKAIFFYKRYVAQPLFLEKHLKKETCKGKKSGDVDPMSALC